MEKGFTLIELLAVIVLIAIIGLITTPIISNTIEDSKKKAFQNSVEGLYDVVNQNYTENEMKGTYSYTYSDGVLTLVSKNGASIDPVTIKTEGKITGNGTIDIDSSGNIIIAIEDSKYCAYTTTDDSSIKLVDGDCSNRYMPNWTAASCFTYEDNTIIDSYDINHDECVDYFINDQGWYADEEELGQYCDGGEDIDGYTLDDAINNNWITNDELISNNVISNVQSHNDGIKITEYKCGGYYDEKDNYHKGSDMNPVIPSWIDGKNVTSIGSYSFSFYDENDNEDYSKKILINSATISENVKTIDNIAFYLNQLTEITLPQSLEKIGSYAFESNNISYVDFSNLTNLQSIGRYAFSDNNDCNFTYTGLNSNVELGDYVFDCGGV